MTVVVTPVRAQLDVGQVPELRDRLARTRWSPGPDGGWETGVPEGWLRELVTAWQHFDVAGFQARLDAYEHLRVDLSRLMRVRSRSRPRWARRRGAHR